MHARQNSERNFWNPVAARIVKRRNPLPASFHRIGYYGLLASGQRAENIARARKLLTLPVLPVDTIKAANTTAEEAQTLKHHCPRCGGLRGRLILAIANGTKAGSCDFRPCGSRAA
jgi:hypothetical protein